MKFQQRFYLLLSLFASAAFIMDASAQTAPKATSPEDEDGSLAALSENDKVADDQSDPADREESSEDTHDSSGVEDPSQESPEAPGGQATADEGIQIQVEKSTGQSGATNQPGTVKVYSPWPAKPISPAPEGWQFIPAPSGVTPFKTTVKLGSGNTVDLAITPYILVPISDGKSTIRIAEPGYDPAQQHAQKETVGTMLQRSTTELENNEKQAASAIMRLQQLLSSLPQEQ